MPLPRVQVHAVLMALTERQVRVITNYTTRSSDRGVWPRLGRAAPAWGECKTGIPSFPELPPPPQMYDIIQYSTYITEFYCRSPGTGGVRDPCIQIESKLNFGRKNTPDTVGTCVFE